MMTSPVLMLLTPLLAVTFGYKPSTDSPVGYDYTVQVEPELVEQMQKGNADSIEFDIPPEVTPIRKIRVVVGTGPLEKKLRPGAAHVTYRQDLNSASIGLLAQTGPAGGYGRGARGFNETPTRAPATPTTANTNPITVPSIGTNTPQPLQPVQPTLPNELRSSIDASFQAAETGINNTANAMNNSLNNVSAASQQAIDDARRTMGELPNNLQQEFRNTTDAMRSSIDRATGATNSTNAGATTPAWAPTASNQNGGRSVLVQPREQTNATAGTTMTQDEQQYWASKRREQQLREQQLRDEQARLAAESAAARTRITDSGFPQQPRLQTLPDRSQLNQPILNDPRVNVVESFGDRSQLTNVNNSGTSLPSITANTQGNASNPATTLDSFTNNASVLTPPVIGNTPQQSPLSRPANPAQPNVASWSPEGQQQPLVKDEEPKQTGLPYGVLAWAVAFGLGFVNLFQWLNLVDMRNKYRVALRRSSPNFSRSMAA